MLPVDSRRSWLAANGSKTRNAPAREKTWFMAITLTLMAGVPVGGVRRARLPSLLLLILNDHRRRELHARAERAVERDEVEQELGLRARELGFDQEHAALRVEHLEERHGSGAESHVDHLCRLAVGGHGLGQHGAIQG